MRQALFSLNLYVALLSLLMGLLSEMWGAHPQGVGPAFVPADPMFSCSTDLYRVSFVSAAPLRVLSVRLHSKFRQKSVRIYLLADT